MKNEVLNQEYILIIAAHDYDRDPLVKALRKDGVTAMFGQNHVVLDEILEKFNPASMLHIWPGMDPQEAIKLHQRLSLTNPQLCRIIQVEAISPGIAAIAADTGIKRVLTNVLKASSVATEVQMALASIQQQPELVKLLQEIRTTKAYDQQKIDKEIERSYLFFPHDPTVRLEFGNLSFRQKRFSLSQEIAESLIAQNPNNVRAINLLARIYMFKEDISKAIDLLESANILSPYNTDRLLLLGDAFYNIGNNQKARDYYKQVLDLDRSNGVEAYKGIVKINLKEGHLNAALQIVQESLSEEEAASIFNNAAIHSVHKGEIESSLQLYEAALKAVKSRKLQATVYFNIALAYERLGRIDESLKNIERSLELDPNFDKTKRHKSRLLSKIKIKLKKAI